MKQTPDFQNQDSELISLLFKRQAELNSLLELTQAINKKSSLKDLLGMLHVILKVHSNIKKFRFFLKKERSFHNLTGFGDEHLTSKKTYRYTSLAKETYKIADKNFDSEDLFSHYDYYVPITHQRKLAAFVLIKALDQEQGLVNHDLNFIHTLVSQLVAALENKKLLKDKMERERLERELELGRQVQHMLIPDQLIANEHVEVNAWYQPHESIGGDYFDFIQNAQEEVMWCIADVSGKGISAALLMANLQASIRAWFSITNNPVEIIQKLNDLIWLNTRGERYITVFLGVYHPQSKSLNYVNAGHQPSILFQKEGHHLLKKGTVILGAFEQLPFIEMGTAHLSPGDLIFNYTDGLLERKNVEEHLSEEQIIDYLKSRQQEPLFEMHQSLLKHIHNSIRGKAPSDDLTLLSIKVK